MSASKVHSVLIVEDERIVAKDLQQTLAGLGYDAYAIASSADEAIARANEKRPDIVLMDIRIKGERDGIQTAQLLKRDFGVPVVFLTAHADDATLERATATGPYGYLLKPVKTAELRSAIEVSIYRHGLECRLREREEWLSTTLRSIGDGVIAVDVDARITFMNPVAERLTGWNATEATGKPVDDVFRVVDETSLAAVPSPLDQALREGVPVRPTLRVMLLSREGGEIPVDESAAPIVGDQRKILGAVLVFRDIRERRRFESQLLVADRMASVGLLAAGVGHEINNPLSAVIANHEFLAEWLRNLGQTMPSSVVADMVEVLDEARQGAERIRKIVRQLRTFSRTERERPIELELQLVLELAVNMTFNELRHRARLVKDYSPTPLVMADESRLAQVLINLLVNAAQAIPSGRADSHEIRIATFTDAKGCAVVEVRDTGRGMPREVVARIFDPFYTTKAIGEGTGLGLSISHSIVTSLGGVISVESELGKGSVFRVVLPPAERRVSLRPMPSQAPGAAPAHRGHVLVVDDEVAVGTSLGRILATEHEVVVLTSGKEALNRIRSGERFDAILCDLMMPVVSGMDLYEEICKVAPEQAEQMIFLTGGAFASAVRDFLDQVPNPRFEKPFDPQNLRAFVRSLVTGRVVARRVSDKVSMG